MRKIAIGIALLVAVSAFAQERRMQSFTERYGADLGLTDTQKTTIDNIEKKWNEDHEKFITEFRATMAEYRAAREANDTAKLDALKPKMDSQRAEMTKLRAEQEEKIASTFTDEQKAKWSKIKEEREARMKAREGQH
jgi:Spy/CpxP family protein refolding chaperone